MVIIVFGVTGAGKTTIGRLLAEQLQWPFYDADEFHSPRNVEKLRRGVPLSEDDRRPWLQNLRTAIAGWIDKGEDAVLACSALKLGYRQYLKTGRQVRYVYLRGSYELIAERLQARRGHFVHPGLLRSQFETLEEPAEGEALVVICEKSPHDAIEQIRHELEV